MGRRTVLKEEKKVNFSISISPVIYNKLEEIMRNRSKYIERLILKDLIKNKHLDEDVII